jgi:hypothetical protein
VRSVGITAQSQAGRQVGAFFPALSKTTGLHLSFQLIWLTYTRRPGHYNRALEEAVQTHKAQWAKDWESKNPLSGGATFATMTPAQRVRSIISLYYFSANETILLSVYVVIYLIPYCYRSSLAPGVFPSVELLL